MAAKGSASRKKGNVTDKSGHGQDTRGRFLYANEVTRHSSEDRG
jgi:hypothetical protein